MPLEMSFKKCQGCRKQGQCPFIDSLGPKQEDFRRMACPYCIEDEYINIIRIMANEIKTSLSTDIDKYLPGHTEGMPEIITAKFYSVSLN
jgi:hypothetical protein